MAVTSTVDSTRMKIKYEYDTDDKGEPLYRTWSSKINPSATDENIQALGAKIATLLTTDSSIVQKDVLSTISLTA